jgi:hypothetical protein
MQKTLLLIWLLASGYPGARVHAGQAWQWVDDQGRQQFSDTRPAATTGPLRQLELPDRQADDSDGGLRAGEIERLRTIEQRHARQHRAIAGERARNDRYQARHRASCRETREHWRSTRDRNRRKEYSTFLRKNCW